MRLIDRPGNMPALYEIGREAAQRQLDEDVVATW